MEKWKRYYLLSFISSNKYLQAGRSFLRIIWIAIIISAVFVAMLIVCFNVPDPASKLQENAINSFNTLLANLISACAIKAFTVYEKKDEASVDKRKTKEIDEKSTKKLDASFDNLKNLKSEVVASTITNSNLPNVSTTSRRNIQTAINIQD